MYYIGLDVHKKTISYCVKDVSGQVHREGQIGATRRELDGWMKTLPQPWMVAMEATIFTGWIYDHLLPHAQQVKVAHPLMLRAIAAAKKKNDRIDAGKIADCLRCDFLPECHMASTAIRDRRRTLRYRHLLVRQMVQMKNRISGLLMETGVSYNKQRLHKVRYFRELLSTNEEVKESIRPLLRLSRDSIVRLQKTEYALVSSLQRDPLLAERIRRLRTVPGVRADYRPDVGTGDGRCFALSLDPTSHQLLRALRCGKELRRQGDAHTTIQTAQQAYPTCARGSREAGAQTGP
jgi:transposase